MSEEQWPPANYERSERVRTLAGVNLPDMPDWKSEHELRGFQEKGVAWAFFAQKGMIADQVGLGKTVQSLALACLMREQGLPARTLVVCPKSAQLQWAKEARRFTNLRVGVAHGHPWERAGQYMAADWDVMFTTYSLLLRDMEYVTELHPDLLVLDEASVFRHHDIRTHENVMRLTRDLERVVMLEATPIQTAITDLHGIFDPWHLPIFGSSVAFDRRYVRRVPVKIRRGRRVINANKIMGYKNMGEFKRRIHPFILRRRATDPEVDAELPEIVTDTIWFDLPRKQRLAYNNARRKVRTLFDSGKRMGARANFHLMQQACDSTRHFDDSDPESVKIEWVVRQLQGGGIDTCVVFAQYLDTVSHVMDALEAAGIGAVRYTGLESSDAEREEIKDRFWNDDSVRVLVGTTALERTLNLQKTSHLININQLWNATRMEQLAGRIRRIGSEHPHAFVINLLTRDTIEERLRDMQAERAAVSDWVFEDTNSLFERLSDEQLQELIRE